MSPSFSPDGAQIAYSSDRLGPFEIFVRQLAPGGREIRITSDGRGNYQPAWSPDGREIAYASRTLPGIWVVPALGGAPRRLTTFGSRPAWSPDGATIAFQSRAIVDISAPSAAPPSSLWVVPAGGGEPTPLTRPGSAARRPREPGVLPRRARGRVRDLVVPSGSSGACRRRDGSLRKILPAGEAGRDGDSRSASTSIPPSRRRATSSTSPRRTTRYLNTGLWRARAPAEPGGPWGDARTRHAGRRGLDPGDRRVATHRGDRVHRSLDREQHLVAPARPEDVRGLGRARPPDAQQRRTQHDAEVLAPTEPGSPTSRPSRAPPRRLGHEPPTARTPGRSRTDRARPPSRTGSRPATASPTSRRGKGGRSSGRVSVDDRSQQRLLVLRDEESARPPVRPTGASSRPRAESRESGLETWVTPLDGGPARRVTPRRDERGLALLVARRQPARRRDRGRRPTRFLATSRARAARRRSS